jgi:hypothetical protein
MLYLLCSKEKFEEDKLYNDVIIIRMVTNEQKKQVKERLQLCSTFDRMCIRYIDIKSRLNHYFRPYKFTIFLF